MFMFVKIVGMSSGMKEKAFTYKCVSCIRENKQQPFQDVIISFLCENQTVQTRTAASLFSEHIFKNMHWNMTEIALWGT